ncbi:NADPH-dependent F420 reductase [Actinophytocola sp.]|uniref:NADPH-dependent F420 reductase n=1 Tax=Actinophytocola sp. TaxID=1872138 RepID=UPI003D6A363D
MKLAVIGAGNVGQAIALASTRAGHDVVITARTQDTAKTVADRLHVSWAASNGDGVRDADAVVIAVPYDSVAGVAREIAEGVAGKPVIDATNPLLPDGSGLAVTDRSGAEVLQDAVPEAFVVKAFNTVFAGNQAEPVVDDAQLDGFYAGSNDTAKTIVAEFLSSVGYRPVDVGDLPAARALEQMAFLNISMNIRNGWPWRSGWKLVGPIS